MKKIIIAIDSFKGCLTSAEAGKAAEKGIKSINPFCHTSVIPIADGGEGLLDVLITATKGKYITLSAHGPLMKMAKTHYGLSGNGRTAIIEMAAISGLPLVPADKRNPMKTTTFGTGELIHDALERGCLRFVIGLGGSATNDAGLGMLQALGFRFFDKEGHEVGSMEKGIALCGALLSEISSIDSSSAHPTLKKACFTAACDVRNPFFGPNGAAHVFAPQKGADADMVKELDVAMQHLSDVIFRTTGKDVSLHPGAGAAGGMGGGLYAFLDAQLKPGIELLLETLDFAEKIKDADLIITGEGKSDRQTLMGKVPSGILQEARRQHIPVILLAGAIEDAGILNAAGFRGVFSITPSPVSLEQAMQPKFAQENIRRTVEQICRIFF
mgnify:CR=1 FL=1